MKKSFIFLAGSSLLVSSLVNAGLVPATAGNASNDTLSGYQWPLKNSGQQVLRDLTDVLHLTAQSVPGHSADIGLDPVKAASLAKRTVLVANLDSGVDLHHPDLVNSLFHNTAECLADGSIPFKPTVDKDNNGFIGDCMGWDFTAAAGSNVQNSPADDVGHGTHVTGIMAAQINNQIGIAGVTNSVKIMPLKVTSSSDVVTNSANDTFSLDSAMRLADRVTKAIRYSILMKVDVINMSMGWSQASNTPALQAAFADAMKAGITIVAAAGNNNNTSFNFPCATPGVICVAANGIDNQLVDFSNYGGHVDIAAPGEEIVSTYPTSIQPVQFSVLGYENLSGTSQASPFVSAAVAVLKSIYPKISEDEVKARLFVGAQDLTPTTDVSIGKFTQVGTLKIQSAIDAKPQAVVVPLFKNLPQVFYRRGQDQVKFTLSLKNYWSAKNGVLVKIQSLSPNFSLVSSSSGSLNFAQGETKNLSLVGKINDLAASKEIKLQVQVQTAGGFSRTYTHVIDLIRQIDGDSQLIHIPIQLSSGANSTNAVGMLKTVSDPIGISRFPDYYWTETKSTGLEVHLVQSHGQTYQESILLVPNQTTTFLTLIKMPVGSSYGYWLGTLGSTGSTDPNQSRVIHYQTFDQNLKNTTPGAASFAFVPEVAVLDKTGNATLHFTTQQIDGVGPQAIPLFMSSGHIPKADVDPDSFDAEDNSVVKPRIYYFKPAQTNGQWAYQTRNFDNYSFYRNLRQQLGLTDSYQVVVSLIGLLPQSALQQSNGDLSKIRMLFSYGASANQKFFIVETDGDRLDQHQFTLIPTDFTSTYMANGVMSPVTDLSQEPLVNAANSFSVLYTPRLAQNIFLSSTGSQVVGKFSVESSTPQDLLINIIQSYQSGNKVYYFSQSKSNLILSTGYANGAQGSRQQTSIQRATWPGLSVQDILFASEVKAGNEWKPAIYVDDTQLYSNSVYYWTLNQQDTLVAPAEFSMSVPAGCRPLTPQKFGFSKMIYGSVLVCPKSNQGVELQVLPLEL